MRLPIVILLISSLLTAACGRNSDVTGGTVDELSDSNGWIAVSSYQDEDWEAYLVDLDSGISHQVTDNMAYDFLPVWSPDASLLAFTSDYLDGEIEDVLLTNEDGSTTKSVSELLGTRDILITGVDGVLQHRIPGEGSTEEHPAWSPDGTRIAYISDGNAEADVEIYVSNVDGSNQARLTNSPGEDWTPRWSPDGSLIAFASVRTGDWEIYTMNSDGSNPVQLTNSPTHDWDPVWSPDGSLIAFASERTGDWEIYTMDPDGKNVTQLTDSNLPDVAPVWSPDGSRIAFASARAGTLEVHIMDSDGSNVERLHVEGIPSDWRR